MTLGGEKAPIIGQISHTFIHQSITQITSSNLQTDNDKGDSTHDHSIHTSKLSEVRLIIIRIQNIHNSLMTIVVVPKPAPETTCQMGLPADRKRRRLMPISPTTCQPRYVAPPNTDTTSIPSIPSLSQILDTGSSNIQATLPAPSRWPRQRTESFDLAFDFDPIFVAPTIGQLHPRSNDSDANDDHYIDHNSFNKRRPPFDAKETDTFAAFTKPTKGSSFGASSSFVGLQGLLPEDTKGTVPKFNAERTRIRRSSSIGLDMSKVEEPSSRSSVQHETKEEGELRD